MLNFLNINVPTEAVKHVIKQVLRDKLEEMGIQNNRLTMNLKAVKAAVLRAYELVPEAYRQRFRSHPRAAKQTYVEFAQEKRTLFEKWCLSNQVTTFEQLQKLILLEFKSSVPENMVIHLNEQKGTSIVDAAVLADEFVLMHQNVFFTPQRNVLH